jgi:hypothetical protein
VLDQYSAVYIIPQPNACARVRFCKVKIMTHTERVKIETLARKSVVLRELWLRERQAALTEQLAANVEVKKRWDLSDPIEITKRQSITGQRGRE